MNPKVKCEYAVICSCIPGVDYLEVITSKINSSLFTLEGVRTWVLLNLLAERRQEKMAIIFCRLFVLFSF